MTFAVLPNMTREDAPAITREILNKLQSLGAECILPCGTEGVFDAPGIKILPMEQAIEQCRAVIAVGGDATIIHAAKRAAACGKPVLGVNAGRLAFMAGLEGHESDLLCRLMTGEYTVDRRLMLKAMVMRGDEVVSCDYCVNDAYITGSKGTRMESIEVALGERLINSYLADGILVATPTGSTAYSLSAGGSVVDPELESILLTPVCSHSLFDRPLVLRPNAVLTVTSAEGNPLWVSLDGQAEMEIKPGCRAVISQAEYKAEFIRIKSDNFIDILGKKLAQRKDSRK